MPMNRTCFGLWLGGATLVLFSWTDLVPNIVGWFGFGMTVVGTMLAYAIHHAPRRRRQPPAKKPDPTDPLPPG